MNMPMLASTTALLNDFLDRGAKCKSSKEHQDYWALVPTAMAAVAGNIESLAKITEQVVGLPAIALPTLALISGAIWCVNVVRSKKPIRPPGIQVRTAGATVLEYRYSQPIRVSAKLSLVVAMIAIPIRAVDAADVLIPLPTTIYGFLYNSGTATPIIDARIRVISTNGIDITKQSVKSDNDGFYIITTDRPVSRLSKLAVVIDGCQPPLQDLNKNFQVSIEIAELRSKRSLPKHTWPVFWHYLACPTTK